MQIAKFAKKSKPAKNTQNVTQRPGSVNKSSKKSKGPNPPKMLQHKDILKLDSQTKFASFALYFLFWFSLLFFKFKFFSLF